MSNTRPLARHHLALGIHPGAFVQSSAPNTSDVQDGVLWVDTSTAEPWQLRCWDAGSATWRRVGTTATATTGAAQDIYVQAAPPTAPPDQALWIDTSSGPPYVQRVWRAATSAWDVLQMDATGYPLPDGARLDAQPPSGPATNGSIHLWDSRDGPLTWIDATTYGLAAGSAVTIGTQIDLRASPLTLAAVALAVPTPIPANASFTFAVYHVINANQPPVQLAKVSAGPEIAQQAIGYNGWPGVVLPSPLTLDDGFGNYVIVVEIVGSQWGRAGNYYGYNDYIDSSAYFVQHEPQPNLNDLGFDPATLISTSDSATGIDIDASYTAPADLLRLVHPDGTVDITHDLTTCRIKSAGSDVLVTPLPVLPSTPAILLGKDPSTGLPAFCPAPIPTTTTVVLGGGGGSQPAPPPQCVQMRCGVSGACRDHLVSLYQDWSHWLDPLFQAAAALGVAVAVATVPWDWIADVGLATAGDAIRGGIVTLLQGFGSAITGNLLPVLDLDLQNDIQRALFDHLTCINDQVQVAPENLAAWKAALDALTTWPIASLAGPFCSLLLQYTPLAAWQAAASTASPSTACDAWP